MIARARLAAVKGGVGRPHHAHRHADRRDDAAATAKDLRTMRKQPQETIATCMAAAQELDTGCEMASYVAALMPVAAVALLRARCRGTGRMLGRSAPVLV